MSGRRILVNARAKADLVHIWSYIAADDPRAADRVLDAIEARWRQLLWHPYLGLSRRDIAPNIRSLMSGSYLVIYHVGDRDIEIVRVLHGRWLISPDVLG